MFFCLSKQGKNNSKYRNWAPLSKPRISANFDFSFVTFRWGFLFILFVLQFWVWIISNYTKDKQWKTFFTQEKLILRLTFNPGVALTGRSLRLEPVHQEKGISRLRNIRMKLIITESFSYLGFFADSCLCDDKLDKLLSYSRPLWRTRQL